MSHVFVAYNLPCPLSILRNSHVPCRYLRGPHIAVTKVHGALSIKKLCHVALSMLGVKCHQI